jgi:hypothetical protein
MDTPIDFIQDLNHIEIQAYPLELPPIVDDIDNNYYVEYLQVMNEAIGQERPLRQKMDTSLNTTSTKKKASIGKNIKKLASNVKKQSIVIANSKAVKDVASKATSLWNNVRGSIFQSTSNQLSDTAEANLNQLCEDISSLFNEFDSTHSKLLADMWLGLFPNDPYQRHSAKWKEAGWQSNDPISDLKASGILALK